MQAYLIITTHRLRGNLHGTPSGDSDPVVVGYLREVQHGRYRMLLYDGANAADGSDPVFYAMAALQAGSKLPATQQAADPCNVAWPFGLPYSADLVRERLVLLGPGLAPWCSYLARLAGRAVVCDGRLGERRPARGHRFIPRAINASNVRRSVAGSAHELGALHPLCVAWDDAASQVDIRMGSGRRPSDRPTHPAERQRPRRDNLKAFRGFATSWSFDVAIVAQSRCRPITANRRRQPTCGSVDRPGPRNPSPNADSVVADTKDPADGPMNLAAWLP
jgi:hypothetical protein